MTVNEKIQQDISLTTQICRMYFSKTCLWCLVCVGIILHFSQYLFNRSLWVDEASVAMQIIESSYSEFVQPLESPVGFLVLEKFLVQVLGESEYILRLFPFLSGVLSLVLFLKLAPHYTKPTAVPIALGLFAISDQLIYHSSTLKQYSSDVCITLILYVVATAILSKSPGTLQILGFGVLGAIALWFAHPAIFILAGLGTYITISRIIKKEWATLLTFSIAYACWLASFVLLYFISFRTAVDADAAQQFWAGHFMPLPPFSFSEGIWFVKTFFEVIEYALHFSKSLSNVSGLIRDIFASMLGLSPSIGLSLSKITELLLSSFFWIISYAVAAFIILAGGISIGLRDRKAFLLLTFPIMFTLLASGLHKYPFANRLILFMLPILFLFLGEGAAWIREKSKDKALLVGIILIGVLCAYPIYLAGNNLIHPRTHEEAHSVLRYLKDHKQEGDVIYVYYASHDVFRYYSRRLGFEHENYISGIMSRENWNKYIEDLQQLRGNRRVWLFFSHAYSEEAFFLYYLDSVGKRLDSFKDVKASVYLYDLH